jgi:hypothetical protein
MANMLATARKAGWNRLVLAAILVAATSLAAASPALAVNVGTAADTIDQVSANDLNADGNEIPFTSTATVVRDVSYDSSSFTTTAAERSPTDHTGCIGPAGADFGGRSGWVRFVAGVAGRLTADVITAGYDGMSLAYDAPLVPFSAHAITPASLTNFDCTNSVNGPGTERLLFGRAVAPNSPVFIQTLGVCGTGTPCANPDPAGAGGGPTTVHLSFVPDNQDGDGVADTLDACPTVAGTEPNGCPPPDRDGDGFADAVDACPDAAGVAPDGCPPDVDGDGIANAADACPFVVGVAPNGCPVDPDADKDGVVIPVDRCPAQAGTAADGCPDTDADGVSDRVDACPKVKGDKANGCPSEIGATFPDLWLFVGRRTKVGTLAVKAPVGARIELRCAGTKRSCAFRTRTIKKTKRARTNLVPLFGRKRLLDPGTAITVRVTVAGRIGSYERLTMRAGRLPKVARGCLDLSGKTKRCG